MALWRKLHKEELHNTLSVTSCTGVESNEFAMKCIICTYKPLKKYLFLLLLSKLHVYSLKHHRFILTHIATFAYLIPVSAYIWANHILGKLSVLTYLRMA